MFDVQNSLGSNGDDSKSMQLSFDSSGFVSRTAIDTTGRVGSFYDIIGDQIFDQYMTFTEQSIRSTKKPVVTLDKLESTKYPNILKSINVEPALRLSIALGMVPTVQLADCFHFNYSINQSTRLLRYKFVSVTTEILPSQFEYFHTHKSLKSETTATHIIVQVHSGIDAVVILQLPTDNILMAQVDSILERISRDMYEDQMSTLTANEIELLKSISRTKAYSNMPSLGSIKSIVEFQREIYRLRHQTNSHRACSYVLCPLDYLFTNINKKFIDFSNFPHGVYDSIERFIIEIMCSFSSRRYAINQQYPLFQKYLKNHYDDINALWIKAQKLLDDNIQQLRQLVYSIRQGDLNISQVEQTLQDPIAKALPIILDELFDKVDFCRKKEYFIRDQLPKNFSYHHAMNFDITENDDDLTLQKKLIGNERDIRIVCSDDHLYEGNPSEWNRMHDQLLEEYQQNQNLRLIYLDFTGHSYRLDRLKIFPRKDTLDDNDEMINVLLVGELGVGKSTLINSLANYFRFKTFSEAESNEPIVVIPTEFSLVDNFDSKKHQVKYHGLDQSNSEDYDNSHQCTTQHCRSYIFTFQDDQKKIRKLRLIDTPGFGDSRGLEQDEQNLNEVLLFVNHLPCLHAICILIKSNLPTLHSVFRSYLLHMLDFLGKDARKNILFCFTHTRIIYFTPGTSNRAVSNTLKTFPVQGIIFDNQTILCFDNEAFPYLLAKRRDIQFDPATVNRYQTSWDQSVKETKRFLDIISTTMRPYEISMNRRSLKRAQLEIQLLIRPIMETIQNILRNIVLNETTAATIAIEFQAIPTNDYTATCVQCIHELEEYVAFYILCDPLHVIRKGCSTCSCPLNEHTFVQYELEYREQTVTSNQSVEELRSLTKTLCDTCVLFSCFLNNGAENLEHDRFLFQLEKMIHEEQSICSKFQSAPLNPMLVDELKTIKQQYQNQMVNMLKQREKRIDLRTIYKSIDQINQVESIRLQRYAITKWYQSIFKHSEFHLPQF